VKQNDLPQQLTSQNLRTDWSFVKTSVENNGLSLQFASGALQADLDTIVAPSHPKEHRGSAKANRIQ
jgi:hypothetical protein